MNLRIITTVLVLSVAFAPVLLWYWSRLDNGSGEALGLVALVLAITLARKDRDTPNLRFAEISILIYGLGFFFLPPLLRIIPALATIAFLTGIHRQAGQFGLLLLSLPVQASLDFFLAYPFRLITAEGARFLVNLLGYPVERLGVQLFLEGSIVSVDLPCSGLQMLWASAFLTALLATLFHLSYRRTLELGVVALMLSLLANTLRASSLFFPEAGIISIPGFAHGGIGLIFFALAGLILVALARKLHLRKRDPQRQTPPITRRFVVLACGVSLVTFLPARTESTTAAPDFPALDFYQGRAVEEIPLSEKEESFATSFPGQLKVYRIENGTLILRRVTKPSRMLHPSYHCLKAEGFAISASSVRESPDGQPFLQYRATRNTEQYLVTESIRTLDGRRHWSEVSAWYWHALFHPNSGPWEAETLIVPIP
jgi:exosortase